MKGESSKLPANYLQPAPVRGQLEPANQRSAPGWRYIQCTDTPNQFRVLLPPRTAEHYEQLLRAEVYELAKQPNLSWERILEIRHLKDRMIRKCQRLSKIVPNRKANPTPGGFAPQTAVAPTDFRLKEMEKWLRTHQVVTKPSGSSGHHHHHHHPSHTHSARKKPSFESSNPTKPYCCVGCQQPNRHHHRPTPSYPDLHADPSNEEEEAGRQPVSPPPAVSPRSTRATAGTPRPRSSLALRRASTGSSTHLRAAPAAGPSRSPSFNANSPYGHPIGNEARASRDRLSDSTSGEDVPQRRTSIARNPLDKGKSPAKRTSMSSLFSPQALSPSAVPGSPPPLPIPYRPSLLFGPIATEEPVALAPDPDTETEQSAEQPADPVLSSSPPEDSGEPKLRRKRSCIKRSESSGEVKTVSWAVSPEVADDISKYVEAAGELDINDKQYEEMRFSYVGHAKALDLLHESVASSLERMRAEAQLLETLQFDIHSQREKLERSYQNLEQKHQSMKDKVQGLLSKQPAGL